jgi:hypothetical protein
MILIRAKKKAGAGGAGLAETNGNYFQSFAVEAARRILSSSFNEIMPSFTH